MASRSAAFFESWPVETPASDVVGDTATPPQVLIHSPKGLGGGDGLCCETPPPCTWNRGAALHTLAPDRIRAGGTAAFRVGDMCPQKSESKSAKAYGPQTNHKKPSSNLERHDQSRAIGYSITSLARRGGRNIVDLWHGNLPGSTIGPVHRMLRRHVRTTATTTTLRTRRLTLRARRSRPSTTAYLRICHEGAEDTPEEHRHRGAVEPA